MLSEGYKRREERKWLHTREIMTIINNTSFGGKQTTPEKIKPLDLDSQIVHDESKSIALFEQLVAR